MQHVHLRTWCAHLFIFHMQLLKATDEEVGMIAMASCDVLLEHGCSKGLINLKKCDVPGLVKNMAIGCNLLKIKAELDQFMDGLNEAGVLKYIQQHPKLFRPMFVAQANPLCAGKVFKQPTCTSPVLVTCLYFQLMLTVCYASGIRTYCHCINQVTYM